MKKVVALIGFMSLMITLAVLNGCRNITDIEETSPPTVLPEESTSASSVSKEETLPVPTVLNQTMVEDAFAQFEGSASEFEEGSSKEETHEDTDDKFLDNTATSETIPNVETMPAPTHALDSPEGSNDTSVPLPETGTESGTNEGVSGEWE